MITPGDMILSNILHDPEFNVRVMPYLEESFFDTAEHQFFFNMIKSYTDKNDVIPSNDAIELMLAQDNNFREFPQSKKEVFLECFENMKKHICEKDPIEVRLENAKDYCRYNYFFKEASDFITKIGNKKEANLDGLEKAFGLSFEKDHGVDFIDSIQMVSDKWVNRTFSLKSNIDFIDRALGGGIPEMGVFAFIANTGVGKTTMLCHMFAEMFRMGKKALFVTLEIDEAGIAERTYANLLEKDIFNIRQTYKGSGHELAEQIKQKGNGNLRIIYDSSGECTALKIKNWVKDLELKQNFRPDIIFVDHISKMKCMGLQRRGNVRGDEILGEITKELRNVSGQLRIPIFSAEQTVRAAKNKLIIDLDDIAGGYSIVRELDGVFGVGEDLEFRDKGWWLLMCLKTRFSDRTGKDQKVQIVKDFQRVYQIKGAVDSEFIHKDPPDYLKKESKSVNSHEESILKFKNFERFQPKILESI